jgi:hypothetical protein
MSEEAECMNVHWRNFVLLNVLAYHVVHRNRRHQLVESAGNRSEKIEIEDDSARATRTDNDP